MTECCCCFCPEESQTETASHGRWCGVAWSVAGAASAATAAAAVGYIYACTNMEMNSEIIVGLVCGAADWMDE